MNKDSVTPLILTYNEEPNLNATLSRLHWALSVVVIDSGSSDETLAIAERFNNVRVIKRAFDNHTNQWNFGLEQIATEWVLTLDADYLCAPDLCDEFERLGREKNVFYASFRYCVLGKSLRSSLYPPRAILFRTRMFRYHDDGHTQLLDLQGKPAGNLRSVILHDDRKSLSHWCASQVRYAVLEAEKLGTTSSRELGWKDRLRKRIVVAPVLTLFYCLFAKRLILDGWAGLFYTGQRVFAELLLSLMLLDRKLRR